MRCRRPIPPAETDARGELPRDCLHLVTRPARSSRVVEPLGLGQLFAETLEPTAVLRLGPEIESLPGVTEVRNPRRFGAHGPLLTRPRSAGADEIGGVELAAGIP